MKKLSIISISCGILFATAFGATSAKWAVTDNADSFGIKLSIASLPVVKHSVTFYKSYTSGTSTWNYPEVIEVDDGSTLEAPSVSQSGYTLKGWTTVKPSISAYTQEYTVAEINSLSITQDLTLYPVLESNDDYVHIVGQGIVGRANQDITISTNSIGKTTIGRHIVGVDTGICNPTASWNDTRILTTNSGIYRFKNLDGGAVCERKINFTYESDASWWVGNSSKTFIYAFGSGDKWYECGLNSSTSSAAVYVGYEYTGFIALRKSSTGTIGNWNDEWNRTVDISLTSKDWGNNTYSSSTTNIYIQDNGGSGSCHYKWK